MPCLKLGSPGWSPIILAILMTSTILISYTMAVTRGDVNALFPYISATGAHRPESCIFGQLLNFTAIASAVCIYFRFCLIWEFNSGQDRILKALAVAELVCGMIAALGLSLVANFQDISCVTVHYTGAVMCFVGGVIYSGIDTAVTFRLNPERNGIFIAYVRLIVTIISAAFLIICSVGAIIASISLKGGDSNYIWHNYTTTESGYVAHVISAFAEWGLAGGFIAYFLTFTKDFDKLFVQFHVKPLVNHLDDTPRLLEQELSSSERSRLITM